MASLLLLYFLKPKFTIFLLQSRISNGNGYDFSQNLCWKTDGALKKQTLLNIKSYDEVMKTLAKQRSQYWKSRKTLQRFAKSYSSILLFFWGKKKLFRWKFKGRIIRVNRNKFTVENKDQNWSCVRFGNFRNIWAVRGWNVPCITKPFTKFPH